MSFEKQRDVSFEAECMRGSCSSYWKDFEIRNRRGWIDRENEGDA